MRRTNALVILASLACVLGGFALTGCGANSNADTTASETAEQKAEQQEKKDEDSKKTEEKKEEKKEESGPTDEEQITANIKLLLGSTISKETILDGLRDDEELANYEDMGMDLEAYAENMANIFKIDVKSVKVDGKTAVATVEFTAPDFGDAASELVDEAVQSALADTDINSMDEDELMAFYMNVVSSVLADPDFPTTTEEINIDYVKKNGFWTMKDSGAVAQQLGAAAEEATSLEEGVSD